MPFDPEDPETSWSLAEALRHTADTGAMALLHRHLIDAAELGIAHAPVEWWHMTAPSPPEPVPGKGAPLTIEVGGRHHLLMAGTIETRFMHKLIDGTLRTHGRPDSMLAAYVAIPRAAIMRIESWWEGGGIVRLVTDELLYAVRVERVTVETRPASPKDITEWYRDFLRAGGSDSERSMFDAAEKYFGRQIRRESLRESRIKVLKEERPYLFGDNGQMKFGRRPK